MITDRTSETRSGARRGAVPVEAAFPEADRGQDDQPLDERDPLSWPELYQLYLDGWIDPCLGIVLGHPRRHQRGKDEPANRRRAQR
jgi:hypothetical protein